MLSGTETSEGYAKHPLQPSWQAVSRPEGDGLTEPPLPCGPSRPASPTLQASAAHGDVGDFQIYPFFLGLLLGSRHTGPCEVGTSTRESVWTPSVTGVTPPLTDPTPRRLRFQNPSSQISSSSRAPFYRSLLTPFAARNKKTLVSFSLVTSTRLVTCMLMLTF